jgi:hypothetical protein
MEIRLQTQHVVLPRRALARIGTRVRDALERLTGRVARLQVTLKDINGPRGGRDKVCILRAELVDGGQVVVVDRAPNLRRAIARCLQRSKRVIDREVKRRHRARRRSDRQTLLTSAI